MNAFLEWPYYVKELDKKAGKKNGALPGTAEHCSAFVATGRHTTDGRIVIAHNNWTSYIDGARWTVIFDIVPAPGHRVLMTGHACGIAFNAAAHLSAHSEFAWQRELLRDMPAGAWTTFSALK